MLRVVDQLQYQYDEKTNEYIALLRKTQVENEKKSRIHQSNNNVIYLFFLIGLSGKK